MTAISKRGGKTMRSLLVILLLLACTVPAAAVECVTVAADVGHAEYDYLFWPLLLMAAVHFLDARSAYRDWRRWKKIADDEEVAEGG